MDTPEVPPLKTDRRARRRQRTRERILDAAARLIAEQGYERTTIEQICERADIALMTFYNTFVSKQQLSGVLSEALLTVPVRQRIEAARAASGDTLERLRHYLLSTAEQVQRYGETERRLIGHLMRDASLRNDQVVEVAPRSYTHAALVELIEEGQQRGDITREFDARLLGEMLAGAIDSIFISWLYDEGYPVRERLAELAVFCERFLAGRGTAHAAG